jgi:hypothetical protein
MVKKVGPKSPVGPTSVDAARSVEGATVGEVGQVSGTKNASGVSRVRQATRRMTSEEREHLFRIVQEEASKMFGPNGFPESKRESVEGAVKMVIDAAQVEEED